MQRGFNSLFSPRAAFGIAFALVTVLLLIGSLWVVNFVQARAGEGPEAQPQITNGYIGYSAGSGYITDETTVAVQAYIQQFPQPQNVKVLTGLSTTQIWGYMTSMMAGGLQVNCTYCHNLANFAAEGEEIGDPIVAERKAKAVIHLQMVQDLNQNWITQLGNPQPAGIAPGMTEADIAVARTKQPSGAQITCATCHLGVPLPVSWPAELHSLPNDYRLPITAATVEKFLGVTGLAGNDLINVLQVTGKDTTVSLDAVQYNQYTMYHQNESLGVGCTHCHNSRYFPSWEVPAKHYAYTMLRMNQYIEETYGNPNSIIGDTFNGQEPSCYLCHRANVRPLGSATSPTSPIIPPVLTSVGQ